MILRAQYNNNIIPYYSDSAVFYMIILHECTRSVIGATPMKDTSYNVSSPTLVIPVNTWSISNAVCVPINYKATLLANKTLPSYITFSSSPLSIQVYSKTSAAVGAHTIVLHGSAKYYDTVNSNVTSFFTLNIYCFTLTLQPVTSAFSETVYLDAVSTSKFTFQSFTFSPECTG